MGLDSKSLCYSKSGECCAKADGTNGQAAFDNLRQYNYLSAQGPVGWISDRVTRDFQRDKVQFMAQTGLIDETEAEAHYNRMFDWQLLVGVVEEAVDGDDGIRKKCKEQFPQMNAQISNCIWKKLKEDDAVANAIDPATVTDYERTTELWVAVGATETNLNPYVRNIQWNEARQAFYNAYLFANEDRQGRLTNVFRDWGKENIVAREYFKEVIQRAATAEQVGADAVLTTAQEENLASRVFRTHNSGSTTGSPVAGYIKDNLEKFRALCVLTLPAPPATPDSAHWRFARNEQVPSPTPMARIDSDRADTWQRPYPGSTYSVADASSHLHRAGVTRR